MISLTPHLYTRKESIDRIEGFVQTACIRITLVDGSTYDRFVSEETFADYADPDGEHAKDYREKIVMTFFGSGLAMIWEELKAKYGYHDYLPQDRETAMATEVRKVIWEVENSK